MLGREPPVLFIDGLGFVGGGDGDAGRLWGTIGGEEGV